MRSRPALKRRIKIPLMPDGNLGSENIYSKNSPHQTKSGLGLSPRAISPKEGGLIPLPDELLIAFL